MRFFGFLFCLAIAAAQLAWAQSSGSPATPPQSTTAEQPRKVVLPEIPSGIVLPPMKDRLDHNIEILSGTGGFDIAPYLNKAIEKIRKKWYASIPREARPPELKQGTVLLNFQINRDGKVKDLKIDHPSGDSAMDRAAVKGVKGAKFEKLPAGLQAPYLALRIKFLYNPEKKPR